MKSSAFADRLDEAAGIFDAAHAGKTAGMLKSIVPIFKILPNKSVSDVIESLSAHEFPVASFMHTKLDTITTAVPPLEQFVSSISSKAITADFNAFKTWLQKNRNTSLEQLVANSIEILTRQTNKKRGTASKSKRLTRTDLVAGYNKRLEEALGDDPGFRQILAKLEQDSEMTAVEMSALAKRFAFASAKGRNQALKKIASRHQDLMISRAASRATAGRVAG